MEMIQEGPNLFPHRWVFVLSTHRVESCGKFSKLYYSYCSIRSCHHSGQGFPMALCLTQSKSGGLQGRVQSRPGYHIGHIYFPAPIMASSHTDSSSCFLNMPGTLSPQDLCTGYSCLGCSLCSLPCLLQHHLSQVFA